MFSAETELGVSLATRWPMSARLVVHGEGGWRADVCASRRPRRRAGRRLCIPSWSGADPDPGRRRHTVGERDQCVGKELKPSPPPPRGPLVSNLGFVGRRC